MQTLTFLREILWPSVSPKHIESNQGPRDRLAGQAAEAGARRLCLAVRGLLPDALHMALGLKMHLHHRTVRLAPWADTGSLPSKLV